MKESKILKIYMQSEFLYLNFNVIFFSAIELHVYCQQYPYTLSIYQRIFFMQNISICYKISSMI